MVGLLAARRYQHALIFSPPPVLIRYGSPAIYGFELKMVMRCFPAVVAVPCYIRLICRTGFHWQATHHSEGMMLRLWALLSVVVLGI